VGSSFDEVVGDGLDVDSEEGVGATARVIQLRLRVVSVQLSPPQEVEDLFDGGDWLFDDSLHIEVLALVLVQGETLVDGVLVPQQVIHLFIVDLDVGASQEEGLLLILLDLSEDVLQSKDHHPLVLLLLCLLAPTQVGGLTQLLLLNVFLTSLLLQPNIRALLFVMVLSLGFGQFRSHHFLPLPA